MKTLPLIVLLGPTASGKTSLACRLAYDLNAEIISADSRQVFKDMNIGTGKDLGEYIINGQQIPYHLIDIKEAGDTFSVFDFQQAFEGAFSSILKKDKPTILCGGTGMYILSILKDYSWTKIPVDENLKSQLLGKDKEEIFELILPEFRKANNISLNESRKRLIRYVEVAEYLNKNPDFSIKKEKTEAVVFGLNPERALRRERISLRLKDRLENGLIEEVENLLKSGISAEKLIFYGLEYKYVTEYLSGALPGKEALFTKLETEIHRFAKRQMTFFRKMEKDGIEIHWLNGTSEAERLKEMKNILSQFS